MRTPNHLSVCAVLAVLITLTAVPSSAADGSNANRAFSKEFLGPMIEGRGAIREWHSALASAIGTKYALTPRRWSS